MPEAKNNHPPIVEVDSRDAQTLADAREGHGAERDMRPVYRQMLVGEHAVELMAKRGELVGVVTQKDEQGNVEKLDKVIDLSNDDFGTEIMLNNPNPYATSHRMNLPETIEEVHAAREKSPAELEKEIPAPEQVSMPAETELQRRRRVLREENGGTYTPARAAAQRQSPAGSPQPRSASSSTPLDDDAYYGNPLGMSKPQ